MHNVYVIYRGSPGMLASGGIDDKTHSASP